MARNDEFNVMDLLKKIENEPYLKALTLRELFGLLLQEKKVDFNALSRTYVDYLEREKDKEHCKTIEATTRLFQMFVPRMKEQPNVINSALYILNKAGNLVYGDLNEQYKYDEEAARKAFEETYGFIL
jgi:hypothetical protein